MLQTQAEVGSCTLRIIGEVCLSLATGLLRAWAENEPLLLPGGRCRARPLHPGSSGAFCVRAP